jgi:hypothetical protein
VLDAAVLGGGEGVVDPGDERGPPQRLGAHAEHADRGPEAHDHRDLAGGHLAPPEAGRRALDVADVAQHVRAQRRGGRLRDHLPGAQLGVVALDPHGGSPQAAREPAVGLGIPESRAMAQG